MSVRLADGNDSLRIALLAVVLAALVASAIAPFDRTIWLAEVLPVLIALPILLATARRFPLTPLCCSLIALFALILILGGAYTYARVPLGLWLQDAFGFARNPYDRLGHFFQGATPAILGRELLLRTSPLRPGKWLFWLLVLACLGISAAYELVEWATAMFWGAGAVDFLGTQGDPWDAQWDMFMALSGATSALLTLSRPHDRQLAGMATTTCGNETMARG
jgi:putative membrane protein